MEARLFSCVQVGGGLWTCVVTCGLNIHFIRPKFWKMLVTGEVVVGDQYGAVKVIGLPDMDSWPVLCTICGTKRRMFTGHLLKRNSACPCERERKNIKGNKYGAWTVISDTVKRNNRYFVLCQCSCGSEPKELEITNLERGRTTGCRTCRFRRQS